MLFVNFKTYKESSGESALELLFEIESASRESGVKVIVAVSAADIREATTTSSLEVWAQHVDAVDYGPHTGAILPEAVLADGAMGTFLNHSEKRFSDKKVLSELIARCRKINLKTLVFAGDLKELRDILEFRPDFVSYEPPDLVGSKYVSVAQAKPSIIAEAVEMAHASRIPLVVGAGIKEREDIKVSVALGADGVVVASDIVLARDPKKEAMELLEGFK